MHGLYILCMVSSWGAVAECVRALAWNGDWRFPAGFEPHFGKKIRFETLAIPFTPLCQCLSDETLNAVGPFYLVFMPGEVKSSHQSAL